MGSSYNPILIHPRESKAAKFSWTGQRLTSQVCIGPSVLCILDSAHNGGHSVSGKFWLKFIFSAHMNSMEGFRRCVCSMSQKDLDIFSGHSKKSLSGILKGFARHS